MLSGAAGAYTVKSGNTLFSLARTSRTTVAELIHLNGLSSTTLEVGQVLRLPGEPTAALPTPLSAPTPIVGLDVTAPATLRMGDAFTLRLSGPRAAQARVRFPSEEGEDVRQPSELLTPVLIGGKFVVLGRVVLGKITPLVFEVQIGGEVIRHSIPVGGLGQQIQRLNLPPRISRKLEDPAPKLEDAAVEGAYTIRTAPVWTKPFQETVSIRSQSSAYGQPRTYVASGPVQYHYGTDSPAPAGTAVKAVNDGTVVLAGMYPMRGGLVVIDHGAGLTSMYFHQRRVLVKPDRPSRAGRRSARWAARA